MFFRLVALTVHLLRFTNDDSSAMDGRDIVRCAYFVAFNYVYIYTLFVQLFAFFMYTCVAALLCLNFVFVFVSI